MFVGSVVKRRRSSVPLTACRKLSESRRWSRHGLTCRGEEWVAPGEKGQCSLAQLVNDESAEDVGIQVGGGKGQPF